MYPESNLSKVPFEFVNEIASLPLAPEEIEPLSCPIPHLKTELLS